MENDAGYRRKEIGQLIPPSDDYARKLYTSDPLRQDYLRSAVRELRLPRGSRGLDLGCGIGLQEPILADEIGPDGHITGLDISTPFLDYASRIMEIYGMQGMTSFVRGDIYDLPFDDNTFDWIWSADCAGYQTSDPLGLIKGLSRVVKPGGIVSILIWSSQMLLPGYPLLEARLNTTSSGIAPFSRGTSPELHYLRALGWFREAGLRDAAARSFVGECSAPLSDDDRNALIDLIDMRWVDVQPELEPEDWELFQSLTQPDSPRFILDLPDYYAFFTATLFYGRVP